MQDHASPAVPSPDSLLADILSSFKPSPKGAKPKAKPRNAVEIPLPLAQSYAVKKTGYRTWKATSRVLHIQKQICNCCGAEVEYVKGEFFSLENGSAHATWLRPEGYGIEAPDDLPITYLDLEPTYTSACAQCRSTPFDDLEALFHPRQLSLPL